MEKHTKNEDKTSYQCYKKVFTKCLIESENKYYINKLNQHKKDSKAIWKLLNDLTKPKYDVTNNQITKLNTEKGEIKK